MGRQAFEIRSLQRQDLFEVAYGRFKKWTRALHIWNPHPGREHYGAPRDQNADVVRAERNGFGHLGEAGAIERDALVVVPGADGFAGSKQKASAIPGPRHCLNSRRAASRTAPSRAPKQRYRRQTL